MFADTWQIFQSVLAVFLVMGLGAWCRYTGWLTREADRSLASLTANVLLPALFLDRLLSGGKFDSLSQTWVPPAFGFGLTVVGLYLAWGLARWLGPLIGLDSDSKQRSFALGVGICNYGYIPLPLAERFYPQAVVDLIFHNVGVDLALWSVGLAIIAGGQSTTTPWRRARISPPIVAVVIGLGLMQSGLAPFIPVPLMQATAKLGSCSIPLGLILSGAIIIDFLRNSTWTGASRTIIASIAFRQTLMPLLILAAASLLAGTVEMKQVLMLQAAMPAAVFPIVLVRLYEKDTETALRVVVSTSLAGIVLVPVWLAIGTRWLGL